MKLSAQAMGALMMALQNSLLTETDIVPVLKGFELKVEGDEVFVENPPTLNMGDTKDENLSKAFSEGLVFEDS